MHLRNGFFAQNDSYQFNLALVGIALTLLLAGAGALSLDSVLCVPTLVVSALGILW